MNIDIEAIKQAFSALSLVLGTLKQAKELLPAGSTKNDVDEALTQAERQLRLAESQAAQGLEYELCKNHFPPGIMLSNDGRHWKCPECGNERDTGPAMAIGNMQDSPRRRKKSLFHD